MEAVKVMAAINIREPVEVAIEQHYEAAQRPSDHPTLRASEIGDECERRLWYRLRWALPPKRFPGRILRLFETGHREELRIIENLRAIGVSVVGEQGAILPLAQGMLTGSIDGEALGVPGAEKTVHLLECKTMNDANFKAWRRSGVKKANPRHFAQMQTYMHGSGLTRALYMAHNKDTDELGAERVASDPVAANQLAAKAERIAFSDTPPPRLSDKPDFWTCKLCDFHGICHGEDRPRAHCRTCIFAKPAAEDWHCTRHDMSVAGAEQALGCQSHLFIPKLLPGEQVDADEQRGTITYRMRDGSTLVDGER